MKGKKCHCKGKGKKIAGVAVASVGVGIQIYTFVKLSSSREAHFKAMVFGLEAANTILTSSLCADPMLPLAAILAIFKATLDSPSVVPKDKGKVAEAGNYLAKGLATIAMLVDRSMLEVVALFDAIPYGKGGKQRGPSKKLLFDIALRLAQRVPLTKLVELDEDIHPYLATLMVATLVQVSKTLVVPEDMQIMMITREALDNMLLKEASHNYNNYRLVSRQVLVLGVEGMPEEVELMYYRHF